MNNDIIAGAVLLLAGVIFSGVCATRELRYRRIARTGKSVGGTCHRSAGPRRGTGGVVHFNDERGNYHRLLFPFSAPVADGAKVTVFYDPSAPHAAVVAEARHHHFAWLLPALAALAAGGNWMAQGVARASGG